MTSQDYWAHVVAALVGTGIAIAIVAGAVYVLALMQRKRAERIERDEGLPCDQANRATDEVEARQRDEPVDEGKLRVAVRRSAEHPPPFGVKITHDDSQDAALFEPAYDIEDTAAIRVVRREMPRDHLLADPPMIEGLTLFTYLKHHAPTPDMAADWDGEGMGVWASFVETFYGRVGHDERVKAKFEGVAQPDLKRHFLRALVTLFNTGLTVVVADELGEAHAHLGIVDREFDTVTEHLVQTLKMYLTPRAFEHVLSQGNLTRAVAALRVRIVRPARVA